MENIDQLRAVLTEQFRTGRVFLFCGRKTSDDEARVLATQSFSGIFTTRTDAQFARFFHNEKRSVTDIDTSEDLQNALRSNERNLFVIRVFPEKFEPDKRSFSPIERQKLRHAEEMLSALSYLIKGSNTLLVTGLDSNDDQEVDLWCLVDALNQLRVPVTNIQFWGINEQAPHMAALKENALSLGRTWYTESIASILQDPPEDDQDADTDLFYLYDEDNEHFYKNGKAYPISKDYLISKRFTLLTQEAVSRNRPIGTEAIKDRFLKFLENSSVEGPQWYGYLKETEYHVRRSFEDPLEEYTRQLLTGRAKHKAPLVLHGDPCTSKSVALGNLAYCIFSSHINPVIFISKEATLFSENTEEFEELLELMRYVGTIDSAESSAGKGADNNARTLLIWDCASYADVDKSVRDLSKWLANKGRRFVLVCSAYCPPANTTSCRVSFINNLNRICADRQLSPDEQGRLLAKICEYLDDDKVGSSVYNVMQETSDIFEIFHTLVKNLRPPLEASLNAEESAILKQIEDEQQKHAAEYVRSGEENEMTRAFREAREKKGEIVDFLQQGKTDASKGHLYDLTRFIDGVALVSRFKMKLPLDLGIKLLKADTAKESDFLEMLYSGPLFKAITQKIPWIHYGLDSNGVDYVFSYRNTREAELRMTRKEMTGEKKADLLCDIIKQDYWDITDSYSLDNLLRYMGPNSMYFKSVPQYASEHRDILRSMQSVTKELEKLYYSNRLDDECADMASILVTMTREFYGTDWNNNFDEQKQREQYKQAKYEERLDKLAFAKKVAAKRFKELEEEILSEKFVRKLGHKNTMCNTLAVEIATCDFHSREVLENYRRKFPEEAARYELTAYRPELYQNTFDRLSWIVKTDPSNGYPYNALFSEFCYMYEHSNLSEVDKLKYLTSIQNIAFECDVEAIQQSRTDKSNQLLGHIKKISEYASEYKVTIENVLQDKMPPKFAKIFKGLLSTGNSSGVTFVAQQELEQAKLRRQYTSQDSKETNQVQKLTDSQLEVCDRVIDFMCREEYYACVCRNYYAVSLLLRTTWMSYTKVDLFTNAECQPISLNLAQWSRIRELGELCIALSTKGRTSNVSPVISLVTILARFHTNHNDNGLQKDLNAIGIKRFGTVQRMRVPFLVYDVDSGEPMRVSGRLVIPERNRRNINLSLSDSDKYTIRSEIRVIEDGIRNQKGRSLSGKLVDSLYLGLGYTGFTAFTQKWLDSREEH